MHSIVVPTAPVGSVTISQVRWAISPARRPAFADSSIMALLRADCLVVSAYNSRSSMLASDKIFACLRAMIQTNQTMIDQYTIKVHLIQQQTTR